MMLLRRAPLGEGSRDLMVPRLGRPAVELGRAPRPASSIPRGGAARSPLDPRGAAPWPYPSPSSLRGNKTASSKRSLEFVTGLVPGAVVLHMASAAATPHGSGGHCRRAVAAAPQSEPLDFQSLSRRSDLWHKNASASCHSTVTRRSPTCVIMQGSGSYRVRP